MKIVYLATILIIFSLLNPEISQQKNPIGQITYKISSFTVENNIFYYDAILTFDSISSIQVSNRTGMQKDAGLAIKTNGQAGVIMQNNTDEKGAIFYRNSATKEFVVRIPEVKPFPPTIITDNWIDIDWKIKNSFKTLLGYKLQKAVGTFRGRTWTVWFAVDIPYPFGPFSLHGLPGVILEAKDKDFSFVATSVCLPCEASKTEKIERPDEEKKMTIKEYVRMTDNMAVYSMLEYQKQGKSWNPGRPMKCLYPATEESIKRQRLRGLQTVYEWENKNTKRAIHNKDTLNATVDYEAAADLKNRNIMPPPGIEMPTMKQ